MDIPKISIIIPVFNVDAYLSRCLNSILNQTYKNYEVLLVDDGSTDKSGEICDAYAKKDCRFHVFHESNGGASRARNIGLDNASGEIVVFIDSDDWIEPNHLSSFLFPGWERYDAVFCQWQQDYPDHIVKNKVDFLPYEGNDFFHDVVRFRGKFLFILTFNKSYKLSIIKKYHIRFREDLKICEDSLFTYEYFAHATLYKLLPTVTYHYTMSDDPRHLTHCKFSVPQISHIANKVRVESVKIKKEEWWETYMDAWYFDRMDDAYKKNIFHRPLRLIFKYLGGAKEITCTYKCLKSKKYIDSMIYSNYRYLRDRIIYIIPLKIWVVLWHLIFASIDGFWRRLKIK